MQGKRITQGPQWGEDWSWSILKGGKNSPKELISKTKGFEVKTKAKIS